MTSIKPALAKGTRDFSPREMAGRNYIFETFRKVFVKYGFAEIQTPSFEMLQTLTGKYGEEGDQLIFKILNSGDFLKRVPERNFKDVPVGELVPLICEKALRYDLTVPFARYVVMHQNEIALPFKRYQIQPVWRADRPQRGRYREFYQCDVDVVGSESLLNEAEFVLIYDEALSRLGMTDYTIKLNNRKVLSGIAELYADRSALIPMTIAIDKLDKIGADGVHKELKKAGFTDEQVTGIMDVLQLEGTFFDKTSAMRQRLTGISIGMQGIEELETVYNYVQRLNPDVLEKVDFDITLARGLNYYTGCIFEVKSNEVQMGSIGGGGRYDDLTGMFGLKGLTGVGISFGADRIYDVMSELALFPESNIQGTQVLVTNFDPASEDRALPLVHALRNRGVRAELYPKATKLKKQLSYANSKDIPYVLLIGEKEVLENRVTVKNMRNGDQSSMSFEELLTSF